MSQGETPTTGTIADPPPPPPQRRSSPVKTLFKSIGWAFVLGTLLGGGAGFLSGAGGWLSLILGIYAAIVVGVVMVPVTLLRLLYRSVVKAASRPTSPSTAIGWQWIETGTYAGLAAGVVFALTWSAALSTSTHLTVALVVAIPVLGFFGVVAGVLTGAKMLIAVRLLDLRFWHDELRTGSIVWLFTLAGLTAIAMIGIPASFAIDRTHIGIAGASIAVAGIVGAVRSLPPRRFSTKHHDTRGGATAWTTR